MIHFLTLLIAIIAIAYHFTPSVLDPVLWTNPNTLRVIQKPLENILAHTQKVSGSFAGPESMAMDSVTGLVYVSMGDGTVRSFKASGEPHGIVFFTGGYLKANKDTSIAGNGVIDSTEDLLNWCNKNSVDGRLAWDVNGETECGRPLGLRLRKVKVVINNALMKTC